MWERYNSKKQQQKVKVQVEVEVKAKVEAKVEVERPDRPNGSSCFVDEANAQKPDQTDQIDEID